MDPVIVFDVSAVRGAFPSVTRGVNVPVSADVAETFGAMMFAVNPVAVDPART